MTEATASGTLTTPSAQTWTPIATLAFPSLGWSMTSTSKSVIVSRGRGSVEEMGGTSLFSSAFDANPRSLRQWSDFRDLPYIHRLKDSDMAIAVAI